MNLAFCVLKVLFDAAGKSTDYRYLETNLAFEKQSGITGARGRTIKEIVPDVDLTPAKARLTSAGCTARVRRMT